MENRAKIKEVETLFAKVRYNIYRQLTPMRKLKVAKIIRKEKQMKKFLGVFLAGIMLVPALVFAQAGMDNQNQASPKTIKSLTRMASVTRLSVTGTVSSISGTTINLTGSSLSYIVDASSAKIMRKYGSVMQVADIATGDTLQVVGTVSGTNVIAKTIRDSSQQQKNGSFAGSVTAVSSAGFTLQTKNRGSQTINTTGSTVFKKAGQTDTGGLADVAVGQNVVVSGIWDSTANTVAATTVSIIVQTKTISGQLSAVSGTSLTVTASGTTVTVYTVDVSNVNKVARRYGASTDLTALQIGDILQIRGTVNGTNVVATTVRDMSLQARSGTFIGTISAINGNSFTLQSKARGDQTINTTSTTVFKQGSATVNISNLAVNQTVTVSGVWDRTNSNVAATRVAIKVAGTSISGTISAINGNILTVVNASSTAYSVDITKAVVTYKNGRKGTLAILQVNDQVTARGQMVSGSANLTAASVRDMTQIYVKPTPAPVTQSTSGQ